MIRIHTLGGLSVRGGDGKTFAGAAAQPRRMAILALLARGGERGMSREKVLTLLWPDADDERGPRALAQALYALRKDLGADDIIEGSRELRLDPALASSDVGEFTSAMSRGDDARAAALYAGPFLDGFHLSGAEDFGRWVERERAALANDYTRAVEALARTALVQGRAHDAVSLWRKLAGLEPLNARFTVGLMEALVAASDRAGAIRQSHVYQLLVEQELDLPPDREVMAYAERLRQDTPAAPSTDVRDEPQSSSVSVAPVGPPVTPGPDAPPMPGRIEMEPTPAPAVSIESGRPAPRSHRERLFVAAGVLAAIALALYSSWRGISARNLNALTSGARPPDAAVVAVGRILSYGDDTSAQAIGRPVAELLATSLARVPGLRVVSPGRILELIRLASGEADSSAGGYVNAARRAGAGEMIDGTVYSRPGGRLRLDLRRVHLVTGAIADVHTVEGSDLFALVDSGTAQLVASLGASIPPGSVADVTTHSAVAYGLYVEGLRTFIHGDVRAAERLFASALEEDSTFAMAAWYHGRVAWQRDELVSRLARALRLSAHASDRERLLIRADWAWLVSSPELTALAESLVTRYPQETEGYLYTGIARMQQGAFLAAIPALRRAVSMDSLSFTRPTSAWGCNACTALSQIILAYEAVDSLAAAEREAQRFTRVQPGLPGPWLALWDVLERAGKFPEAERVAEHIGSLDRDAAAALDRSAYHAIRMGRFDVADRLLRAGLETDNAYTRRVALWALVISLRYQGRLTEAMEAARRFRSEGEAFIASRPGAASPDAQPLAAALLESGRPREAAALFDSIARWKAPDETESGEARFRAWGLTHAAHALAAAGDTTGLATRADSIAVVGARSVNARDQRLHLYARGLLLLARNDLPGAEAAFRASIFSMTAGYTRANAELAKVLIRLGRPREAVAVLQPALRGKLDASNFYITHTELHEALGEAWAAAGGADSAAAHFALVAHAWAGGDPEFRSRAAAARARAASLLHRPATKN